jgi:hypothetical protein
MAIITLEQALICKQAAMDNNVYGKLDHATQSILEAVGLNYNVSFSFNGKQFVYILDVEEIDYWEENSHSKYYVLAISLNNRSDIARIKLTNQLMRDLEHSVVLSLEDAIKLIESENN